MIIIRNSSRFYVQGGLNMMYRDSLLTIDAETKHKFNVHPPANETEVQKNKRHDVNGARFLEWAKTNPCNLLVSYPRSGRCWIADILHLLTDKLSVMPYEINGDNYTDFALFTTHGYRFNYAQLLKINPLIKVILLIRDPRDCALSDAYRSSIIRIPDFGYDNMCYEIVEKSMELTATHWQDTFEKFSIFNHIIMRYESLCLSPVDTIANLLRFMEISDVDILKITNAVNQTDQIKFRHGAERIEMYKYSNDLERYQKSCLKWQKDIYWLPRFSEMIWQQSGTTMQLFGYTENGHDINKF